MTHAAPGGAVTPAMKPTIGFLIFECFDEIGGIFLALRRSRRS